MEVLGVVRLLAEAGVVIGQKTRQQLVSGGDRADTLKAKLLDQAILQGLVGALDAALRLRCVGAQNVDVERANKTLQDRLVKELRLQGVSTIAAGNQLLPGFLADYNTRFGKEPHNPKNLHRPLSVDDNLVDVFAWREERTISNNLTLQYDKVVFLIEPNELTRELRRKRVTVVDYPDGRSA